MREFRKSSYGKIAIFALVYLEHYVRIGVVLELETMCSLHKPDLGGSAVKRQGVNNTNTRLKVQKKVAVCIIFVPSLCCCARRAALQLASLLPEVGNCAQ